MKNKMRKSVIALWVAWMLAWSPNVQAWVKSTEAETNEALIEVVSKDSVSKQGESKVISLEQAEKLARLGNNLSKLMKNKRFQQILKKHNIKPEDLKSSLSKILADRETALFLIESIENEDINESITKADIEAIKEKLDKIDRDNHIGTSCIQIMILCVIWLISLVLRKLNKNDLSREIADISDKMDDVSDKLDELLSKRPII